MQVLGREMRLCGEQRWQQRRGADGLGLAPPGALWLQKTAAGNGSE